MLAFRKCVLFEFKVLIAKMANDMATNAITKNNYEVFYNYEIVLGLTCAKDCAFVIQLGPRQRYLCM
jgi:hypothetical protein